MFELHELEAVYGTEVSSDDEPTVQAYMELVTTFIESYTGLSFSLHEDQVLVARADGKGVIEIDDLVSVASVEALRPSDGSYWSLTRGTHFLYDGIDRIYDLCAYGTYRITASYGDVTVPADLKQIAIMLTLVGSGLDSAAVNGLKALRVGDVEEAYGVSASDTGEPLVTLNTIMTDILNRYASGTTTYRV